MKRAVYIVMSVFLLLNKGYAQSPDTLTVMTYNVLNYGDQCQGQNNLLHAYLKTIVAYVKPDILGLVKMASIKLSPTDINNFSPYGFADSVVQQALTPGTLKSFAYCPFTNVSGDDKVSVLFYNTDKLGFVSKATLTTIISDFNLYKLYYKDPYLTTTHDTTFLYVVLNHTQSGSDASTRNQQEADVLTKLKARFKNLPNLIMMGDFNIHNSSEAFYQSYISPTDFNFQFFDPPFSIDANISYPADWDTNPGGYANYLTTSTRQSASDPNTCGTSGGAKSWYDHILLSSWLKDNTNYMTYEMDSYRTIGNDGKRTGISINDSTTAGVGKNVSAPGSVINALFQLSNKYPVSVNLLTSQNTTGQSPVDPDNIIIADLSDNFSDPVIHVKNPLEDNVLSVRIPRSENIFTNKYANFSLFTMLGEKVWESRVMVADEMNIEVPLLSKQVYILEIFDHQKSFLLKVVP